MKPHAVDGFMGDLTEATHHCSGDPSERYPCFVDLNQVRVSIRHGEQI